MSGEFPLKGGKELDMYLSHFQRDMQSAAIRAGLVAAAGPPLQEARQRARKRSGKMARAIKKGSARDNRDGTFSITIGMKGEHGFLGLFWHYGVAPHFLQGGDSGISPRLLTRRGRQAGIDIAGRKGTGEGEQEVLNIGGKYVTGAVFHPGLPADPFLTVALDLRAADAVDAFGKRIREWIEGKTGLVIAQAEAA